MQTLQQKREYTVAVLDPAGNVTAIVCSDVPAAERARVAAQILRPVSYTHLTLPTILLV